MQQKTMNSVSVARYPLCFAVFPVCFFCLFFIPFLDSFSQLFREPSAIGSSKLFVPKNSASERNKHKIEKIFPHGLYYYDRTFLSPNLRILSFEVLSGSIYEPQFVEFYQNLRNKLELLSTIFTGTTYGGVHTERHSGDIISARCVRMIFNFPPPYHIAKFGDMWDRLLPLLAFCLVTFCCLSSMKYSCNLRFILLSFYGVLSAACGLVTAIGFLHIIGIHLVQVALVTPFLVLSIGIDDMFIMLSIWRQTISASSTGDIDRCDLMRITFRESIVSILLTTTGNVFVFTLGSFAPFPIIRIFCIYSAVSLLVVFLFQLTLFGSLLATNAPDSLAQSRHSSLPLLYATIFKNKYFIALICLSYVVYLSGSSIILNRKIDIGLQLSSLLPIDTGTYKYLKVYEEYFSEYSTPLEIVLPDESDYFDRHFQWRLFHAIAILEYTNYTMKATFWLPLFLDFLKQFAQDIIFERRNNGRLFIKSSRLHMPLFNVTRLNRRSAMHLIRGKVKTVEKRYSIRFLTYHVMYDLVEQDDLIPHLIFTNALLDRWLASTCAIILLTPSLMNCILIIWTTFSINFGVFALLSICGIHLGIISSIVILLSIGYSVDYSSHVLAHFYHFERHSKDPIGN